MSRVRRVASAVLCGAVGGGFMLSAVTGSPGAAILVSLAQLPVFMAGLWLGAGAAATAGLAATAVVLAAAHDLTLAALFAGLYAVPVVLLVRQALLARTGMAGGREWYPAGRLAAWLTGLALGGAAIALLLSGGPRALQAMLRQALVPVVARLSDPTAVGRDTLVDAVAAIMPGVLTASWMLLVIANGVLAQGVLARFAANRRPSPRLAELRLPLWITVLLGAAVASILWGGPIGVLGINAAIVLSIPFGLAGLAVVHALAHRLARPAVPLAAFYIVAGLFGWPLLLVALLGLVDVPLDLRRRLAGRQSFGGETNG